MIERPPPMPGVYWARVTCPSCGGDWWHGLDARNSSWRTPLFSPISPDGLSDEGREMVQALVDQLGVCADCRADDEGDSVAFENGDSLLRVWL